MGSSMPAYRRPSLGYHKQTFKQRKSQPEKQPNKNKSAEGRSAMKFFVPSGFLSNSLFKKKKHNQCQLSSSMRTCETDEASFSSNCSLDVSFSSVESSTSFIGEPLGRNVHPPLPGSLQKGRKKSRKSFMNDPSSGSRRQSPESCPGSNENKPASRTISKGRTKSRSRCSRTCEMSSEIDSAHWMECEQR